MSKEIIKGIARGNWVLHWADRQEEKGRSFGGVNLDEVAPKTPSWAIGWAVKVGAQIERLNGMSLSKLYEKAVELGYPKDEENFGSDLGLQSVGHGVSWTDDIPWSASKSIKRDEIKLPHTEFYR